MDQKHSGMHVQTVILRRYVPKSKRVLTSTIRTVMEERV